MHAAAHLRPGLVAPAHLVVLVALLALCVAPGAGRAAVPTGFTDELVVSGLSQPAGFAFLPDGRMIVTEQNTRQVHLITTTGVDASIFSIADVNISGNERGLLGVTVDPDWPVRPYLYFYFNRLGGMINIRMYTASGNLTDPLSTAITLSSPFDIITDIPDAASNHNGGTVRFGPDGMLYASSGDDASMCNAQDPQTFHGVILRLDVSSLPGAGSGPPAKADITPADNPFAGSANENERLVFAYGLRNPFRFNVDPETGLLYVADVGQSAWEELDECSGGENFGWPHREGAHTGPGTGCPGSGGVDPIFEYSRLGFTASIISGPRYRPVAGATMGFPAEYYGDVFFVEYYQGWIRRIQYDAQLDVWTLAPAVPGQPTASNWATGITNASDFLVGPDGAIYYVKQFPGSIRRIAGTTGVSVGEETAPAASRLGLTVAPNPVRVRTNVNVSYSLPTAGEVTATVYGVNGKRLLTLFSGRQSAGDHQLSWDGHRSDRSAVVAGVYFVRVSTDAAEAVDKLTIVR